MLSNSGGVTNLSETLSESFPKNIWKFVERPSAKRAYQLCVFASYGSIRIRPCPHYSVFKRKRSCFAPNTAIVHTTTPKTITENGAIRKSSPEWSDLKTLFSCVDDVWTEKTMLSENGQAPDHSTASIQNGGQTLPCGFNFALISRADILKCASVEFICACALRV